MKSQRGVGLIEVLVSTLVVAVGLLGIAGLQSNGLQHNKSSYQRSQATFLALDMLDRMRVNQAAAAAGDYDHDGSDLTAPANTCLASTCNTSQLATADLYDWMEEIGNTLPDGSGTVSRDATNPNIITVTVRWNDNRADTVGTTCGTDLLCMSITTDL